MILTKFVTNVRVLQGFRLGAKRALCLTVPASQKASDPVQQLFLDKLKEYSQKSGGGAKLVEPTPEIDKEWQRELGKLAKIYGGSSKEDMTKFPTFNFKEPSIDSINLSE